MKKKYIRLLVVPVIGALSGLMLASSCNNADTHYTRGIGIYPGNPKEDFSPTFAEGSASYRNIAHMRSSLSSSQHDYNLTAQLLTDGIISTSQPPHLVVSTPEGELPRREREWMIDEGPYSRCTFTGGDTYFQFSLKNYAQSADSVKLTGMVIYHEKEVKGGYALICQGSHNGTDWKEIGKLSGKGLPGEAIRRRIPVTDPNKQTERITLPVRRLNETIVLHSPAPYSHYRVLLQMQGAHSWQVMATDFYDKGKLVEMKPAQHFHSAWMSATAGEEWVSVDLGVRSRIDKVVLHWLNKAVKGQVQISNDTKEWNTIAELPSGNELKDEISFPEQQARYVRILMQEAANGTPYILSELEVMGKGGLTPQPAEQPAITDGQLTLSGGHWKLQRASEVNANGEQIASADYPTDNWIIATVPGTVLSSYINIDATANPNYADNQNAISESFFRSNFWYRNEFDIPADFKQERLFLNFDGINWKANVFVNGKQVGRIEGAFICNRCNHHRQERDSRRDYPQRTPWCGEGKECTKHGLQRRHTRCRQSHFPRHHRLGLDSHHARTQHRHMERCLSHEPRTSQRG